VTANQGVRYCSGCGKPQVQGSQFCPQCGNALYPSEVNVQASTPAMEVAKARNNASTGTKQRGKYISSPTTVVASGITFVLYWLTTQASATDPRIIFYLPIFVPVLFGMLLLAKREWAEVVYLILLASVMQYLILGHFL